MKQWNLPERTTPIFPAAARTGFDEVFAGRRVSGGCVVSLFDRFLHKKFKKGGEEPPLPFSHFLEISEKEIDELISQTPRWFQELPYVGAMSKEAARELEIEKRAMWRRIIYDAKRSNLPALKWECSEDEKVCPQCTELCGQVFRFEDYGRLDSIRMHVGCRCNLTPVR
jgi:SPP1 gp7 family putative phage head morphogenesis protein